MILANPIFGQIGAVLSSRVCFDEGEKQILGLKINIQNKNYYMDNIICQYSKVMAKCAVVNEQISLGEVNLQGAK